MKSHWRFGTVILQLGREILFLTCRLRLATRCILQEQERSISWVGNSERQVTRAGLVAFDIAQKLAMEQLSRCTAVTMGRSHHGRLINEVADFWRCVLY